jgi:hypothetical protein
MDHVAIRVDEEADHVKNRTSETGEAGDFSARIRLQTSRGGNAAVYARRRETEGGWGTVVYTVARSGPFWQKPFGEVRRGRAGGMIPFIAVYLCFTTRPPRPRRPPSHAAQRSSGSWFIIYLWVG